jgi:hypothetical protein
MKLTTVVGGSVTTTRVEPLVMVVGEGVTTKTEFGVTEVTVVTVVGMTVGRTFNLEIFDHETYNSSRRECDND